MLPCPIPKCGHKNDVDAKVCANCGEDISSFAKLYFLPAYHYNKGLEAYQKGELDNAIEELLLSSRMDQGSIDALILLGKICAQKKDYKNAIDYWERVLDISPGNIEASSAIEKAAKLLDTEPVDAHVPEEGIFRELNILKDTHKEQIGNTLELFKGQKKEQDKQTGRIHTWLKVASSISIAACVLVVISAFLLWNSLNDKAQQNTKEFSNLHSQLGEITSNTEANLSELRGQISKLSAKAGEDYNTINHRLDELWSELINQEQQNTNQFSSFQSQVNGFISKTDAGLSGLQEQIKKLSAKKEEDYQAVQQRLENLFTKTGGIENKVAELKDSIEIGSKNSRRERKITLPPKRKIKGWSSPRTP